MNNKRRFLFFASITFLLLFFESCRSAKYLDEDQSLVTKVDIQGVPTELRESAYQYISNEIRPNSALNLTLYNIFNTKNGKYKTEKIRQVGEPPHILDSSLVDLSALQIQRFLQTKGYFKAHVSPQIETNKKKTHIHFLVEKDTLFRVGNIEAEFDNRHIELIYHTEVEPFSKVKTNEPYDMDRLVALREALYMSARDKGYYDYLRQHMRVAIDTTKTRYFANLKIQVSSSDDTLRVYKINDVRLVIHTQDQLVGSNIPADTIGEVLFTDYTNQYKAKPLMRYMFLKKGENYSLANENISYDRLYETNGFRNVRINYEKVDSSRLNVTYELIPRALMSNQIEGEYTFSSGMRGFNVGNTFSHRNIFGGSELLELKVRYGLLFDPRLAGSLSQKIFNNDFQAGVNLVVPRMLLPFGWGNAGRYGLPKTTFSTSLQIFNQDQTYSNRYLINTLNYSWWQNPNLQHSYTPIVVEYRAGKFDENFRNELLEEGYQLYIASNDRQYFGLGAQYAITWNNNKLQKLDDFSFFRGAIDLSGNTLGLLSSIFNFRKNDDDSKTLFGVTYLQYFKGEVDYRLYRYLGGNKQVVFRFNGGAIVPYGNNSRLLIFEKSFYAGGMNGMRAWQARTLGPGNYNRSSIREELRRNLRNLDQLGELKLETNLEYRFRIWNNFFGAKLNGATFLDMGNIWLLRENELNRGGLFKFDRFFSQVAIGTGVGLRFDMDYFTVRLDTGLKLKDPQFEGKDQWVIQHLFNLGPFKRAYYDTHKPDRYGLFQFNFGVGMPF